ncbi:MAG TPA: NADH-quinone oxidoreductase subunit C [Spirochaetia bacterium]|nr:NADH-quinone oxidoreductase subunit C [Spirochaetia bacterium]
MSLVTSMESISELAKSWDTHAVSPAENRYDIVVTRGNLLTIVAELLRTRWGFLTAITARDVSTASGSAPGKEGEIPADRHFEIYYHFCRGPAVLTLRLSLPHEKPSVPSICGILPSASIQERELAETFGIEVEGLPKAGRLFLSDDWPAGLYPLRKDTTPQSIRDFTAVAPPPPATVENDATPGKFTVPIGPQHPALKEPAHFELNVDGEIVTGVSLRLGYVHRGIEKAAEGRPWVQNLYLMERVCGICSHIHSMAYALGVETVAGIAAPPRAQAIRVLIAEMERIHSHLLWLGVAAHEAGFDTLFMYTWRDRETIMDLLEQVTGNRVNYSVNLLGGVKYDVDPSRADAIRRGLDRLEPRINHYLGIVTTDESFLRRTRGIGVFSTDQADFLGVVGPTLRASNVHRDVRVDAPYSAYRDFPVTPVYDDACDLAARVTVRVKELQESCRLVRAVLDALPPGDRAVDFPRRVPEGEAIIRVEAPRGELFYYVRSAGGISPDRVKIRTPSLANWAYVMSVAVGHKLADIPMIVVGIDPCFSCNDRTFLIRQGDRKGILGWDDLRRYAMQRYGRRAE